MAKADTFNIPGNREDLTDIITTVFNTKTPLLNLAKRGKAKAMLHEFQSDKFDNPVYGNPVPQGSDVSSFKNQSHNKARFGGRVQRFMETVSVSTEEEIVIQAGVSSESAFQKMKAMTQLQLQVEACLGSDQASSVAGEQTFTRGVGQWLVATAQTDQPVPAAYLTPTNQINSGAYTSMVESVFKGLLQAGWEQGGDPTYAVVGTDLATQIDTFLTQPVISSTQGSGRYFTAPAEARTIYDGVDFYNGPYGKIKIIRSIYNGRSSGGAITTTSRRRGYMFNPDLLEVAVLQEMGFKELPDEGGGFRGFVDCFYAFGFLNPLGGIKMACT